MKILHVLAQMPAKTGSGVYFGNVVERLKDFGHHQRVVFASQGGSGFPPLEETLHYPVPFQSREIPFPIAGMSDAMPYESTRYSQMDDEKMRIWLAAFRLRLQQAKTEFAPDVVILHHLWILTSLGAEMFDTAVTIGVCHNTDLRQARQNPALKQRYVTAIPKLDAIFSLSDAQKQTIADLYDYDTRKITTIGGGFDESIFYPPPTREHTGPVRLVYAAKIASSKGIYSLIPAYQKARLINPCLQLDIIGTPNGENAPILAAMAGADKSIHLYGAMPQQQLAQHLRGQDIFVMPSFFEGIALMALESLACGLWTVASEIEPLMALLGDSVNQSGVIEYVKMPRVFDTDKPCPADLPAFEESLATKMLAQAEKVQRGLGFPADITAQIEQHSWRRLIERINTLLCQLAGSKNASPHP